jgi:uncharacterized repeat protein (TIGR03803 family)
MSGYPREIFEAVSGKLLKFGGMLGTAALLVLIAGAGQPLQGQTYAVLHNFNLDNVDGVFSVAGVVRDPAGNLYGTTKNGGASSQGTVFKIDASGNETVLHSFSGIDGANPSSGLVLDSAGDLYGTTASGGVFNSGTVFEIDTSGNETVLHSFDSADGAFPYAGLARDAAGNLYGTTLTGGAAGSGVVFKIDTSGNETVLHSFSGSDGGNPFAGVILDSAGNLYGTTFTGGASGYGTVFKLDASGNETVLHSFIFADGANPYGGLALDLAGNLYGTTQHGGASGYGTVFKIDPSGNETVLSNLNPTSGGTPYGGVVLDAAGNLYGTAFDNGSANLGTVFKVDPSSGQLTVIHNFASSDGGNPKSTLAVDSAGNLYGTTSAAGALSYGTVFEIVQVIPFATFNAKLELTSGFELKADFALGAGAKAINPATQGLILTIGVYSVTIPACAFQQSAQGWFEYDGTMNGAGLRIRLTQTGANTYELMVHASGVDMGSPTNPVTMKLAIGNNSGATQVDAH